MKGTLPIPIDASRGFLSVADIKKHVILDKDIHHAPTQLICLENTMNGEVYPFSQLK
jgi:threonine aldolase